MRVNLNLCVYCPRGVLAPKGTGLINQKKRQLKGYSEAI